MHHLNHQFIFIHQVIKGSLSAKCILGIYKDDPHVILPLQGLLLKKNVHLHNDNTNGQVVDG